VGEISKNLEMNFWKPKEVFVGDGIIHKNFSQFFHNYNGFGDMNKSQEFSIFIFLK